MSKRVASAAVSALGMRRGGGQLITGAGLWSANDAEMERSTL